MVAVSRETITIDIDLCKDRFVRTAEVPFEDEFSFYIIHSANTFPNEHRIYSYLTENWSTSLNVPCSAEEEVKWRAATHRFLDALSDAHSRLLRAHGVRKAYVDHWTRRTRGGPLRSLPPFPGRKRWLAARSRRAQQEFLARARAACEEYEPVRAEIERRVQAVRAELAKKAQKYKEASRTTYRRKIENRWGQPLRYTRRQRVWMYAEFPKDSDGTVYVYRRDVPPVRNIPPDAQRTEKPLTIAQLEAALRPVLDDPRRRVVWDPGACAKVEQSFKSKRPPLRFHEWLAAVTSGEWFTHRMRHSRTRPTTLSVTTHHSAHAPYWPDMAAFLGMSAISMIGIDYGGGDAGGGDYGGGDAGGGDYGGSDGGAGGYSFGGSF